MAVLPEGKGRAAISEYKTVESFADHTLLAFHPITGRTHQIRVHCAFLGCPVVGDTVYGQRKSSIPMDRLFLHAQKITLALPGERQSRGFEAPVPDALNQILADLRGQTPPQPSHGQNRKSTWIP